MKKMMVKRIYIALPIKICKNTVNAAGVTDIKCELDCAEVQGVLFRCQCVYTHQAGKTQALQQHSQSSEKLQMMRKKHNI